MDLGGPSGPATSLRGNMCWVHDCVAGVGWRIGGVGEMGSQGQGGVRRGLGPVGVLDEEEGEGWLGGG